MTINPRPRWGSGGGRLLPPLVVVGGDSAGGTVLSVGADANWGMPATNFTAPMWATKMRATVWLAVHGDIGGVSSGQVKLQVDTVQQHRAYFYIPNGGYVGTVMCVDDYDVTGGATYSIRTRINHDVGSTVSSVSTFSTYACHVWWERS